MIRLIRVITFIIFCLIFAYMMLVYSLTVEVEENTSTKIIIPNVINTI